ASVRGYVLAESRRVGLCDVGAAGQLLLQAATLVAMVQRQHRIPSHTSSQPENSELQIGAVSRRESALPGIHGPRTPEKFEIGLDETVGRGVWTDGRLQVYRIVEVYRKIRNGRNRKNPLPFFFPAFSLTSSAPSSSFFFDLTFTSSGSSLFFDKVLTCA